VASTYLSIIDDLTDERARRDGPCAETRTVDRQFAENRSTGVPSASALERGASTSIIYSDYANCTGGALGADGNPRNCAAATMLFEDSAQLAHQLPRVIAACAGARSTSDVRRRYRAAACGTIRFD